MCDYKYHFQHLMHQFDMQFPHDAEFKRQLFQTMDFSTAQNNARIECFQEIWYRRLLAQEIQITRNISKERREILYEEALRVAEGNAKGCLYHLKTNTDKIANNPYFVGQHRDLFKSMMEKLFKVTTYEEFSTQLSKVSTKFDKCQGWLDWWTDPSRRILVFGQMQEDRRKNERQNGERQNEPPPAPTSNAVESIHHWARDHDKPRNKKAYTVLLDGVKSLVSASDTAAIRYEKAKKGAHLVYENKSATYSVEFPLNIYDSDDTEDSNVQLFGRKPRNREPKVPPHDHRGPDKKSDAVKVELARKKIPCLNYYL